MVLVLSVGRWKTNPLYSMTIKLDDQQKEVVSDYFEYDKEDVEIFIKEKDFNRNQGKGLIVDILV